LLGILPDLNDEFLLFIKNNFIKIWGWADFGTYLFFCRVSGAAFRLVGLLFFRSTFLKLDPPFLLIKKTFLLSLFFSRQNFFFGILEKVNISEQKKKNLAGKK
jgi:hypothetical protein